MKKQKEKNILFRVTEKEKETIEEKAKLLGFHSTSEYIRYVCVNIKDLKIII